MKQTNIDNAITPTFEEINALVSRKPGIFTIDQLNTLMEIFGYGELKKTTITKVEKFHKEYPEIEFPNFEFDADKQMSKKTRHTILYMLADVLNYCRSSDFVDYLKKSNRIEYLIEDLMQSGLTANEYTSNLASLWDFYSDYKNGDTSHHKPKHQVPKEPKQ